MRRRNAEGEAIGDDVRGVEIGAGREGGGCSREEFCRTASRKATRAKEEAKQEIDIAYENELPPSPFAEEYSVRQSACASLFMLIFNFAPFLRSLLRVAGRDKDRETDDVDDGDDDDEVSEPPGFP